MPSGEPAPNICFIVFDLIRLGLEPNNLPHPRRECQSLHRSGHKLGFEPTIYHSLCCQPLHHRSGHNKSLKKPEAVYRRTDNTMSKGKGAKGQTTICKILHRKLKIEQQDPPPPPGRVNSSCSTITVFEITQYRRKDSVAGRIFARNTCNKIVSSSN